jgi:hypothetical protein
MRLGLDIKFVKKDLERFSTHDWHKSLRSLARAPFLNLETNPTSRALMESSSTARANVHDLETRCNELCQAIGSLPALTKAHLVFQDDLRYYALLIQNLHHLQDISLIYSPEDYVHPRDFFDEEMWEL